MKKYLSIFLALALVLALTATAFAAGRQFADVSEDAWYAEAVAWAVENGITNGTGGGGFSPDEPCTRGQMVTFLYRYHLAFGGGTGNLSPAEPETEEPPEPIETQTTETEEPTEPPVTEALTEPEVPETEAPTEPPETEAPTEPAEPEPTEPPTEPSEPELPEPAVYELVYADTQWSGEEILLEALSGRRVSVYAPGIGEQFSSGDTVRIEFDGSGSLYLQGPYIWRIDMGLQEPITALLNQTCIIDVLDEDEIILRGNLPADIVSVCMLGDFGRPAVLRLTKQ